MTRTITAAAACLAAALAATNAAAADRALLIGIDDYSAVAGAPTLNGARADVERMAEALTGPLGFAPEAVTRLTDAAAGYDAILSATIDRLVGETGPGDRVVLYFAGLGTTLPDGAPALLAHDGDAVLGKIPLTTIADILTLITDREVTVILDAGFDGGPPGVRGMAGAVPPETVSLGEGVALWTAATGGQFAWEDIDRGIFTTLWADAIAARETDADGDGVLTNAEVLGEVQRGAAAWCDAAAACTVAGRGLAPSFSGDGSATLLEFPRARPVEVALDPIEADDGAPASYRETLGFVTDLFAPSNEAGLDLSIVGGERLKVGDFVTFQATATRPGALLLLDVDPDGALVQVYPSVLTETGGTRLSPEAPLTIPSALGANGNPLRIRVTEPAGQGLLLGLFIEGNLTELSALMPAGLSGGPVPEAGQSLFEISQNLLRMAADPDRPVSWSATYLPYRIEP